MMLLVLPFFLSSATSLLDAKIKKQSATVRKHLFFRPLQLTRIDIYLFGISITLQRI